MVFLFGKAASRIEAADSAAAHRNAALALNLGVLVRHAAVLGQPGVYELIDDDKRENRIVAAYSTAKYDRLVAAKIK